MTNETVIMATFYAKKVAGVKSSLYEHYTQSQGEGLCREYSARRDGSYTYTKDIAIQTSESHNKTVATMRHELGKGWLCRTWRIMKNSALKVRFYAIIAFRPKGKILCQSPHFTPNRKILRKEGWRIWSLCTSTGKSTPYFNS